MTTPDRIIAGRKARLPGDPWTGVASMRGPSAQVLLDPEAQARTDAHDKAEADRVGKALRAADERGYHDGRARAEDELASAIAAAGVLARSLETAVPRDVDMVARTVAELAILIARRIIGAELRHDPSVLIAAIEAGLKQAVGASSVQVELHADAAAPVEAAWLARHGQRHRGLTWSFVADPTLPFGGCRLRTEYGLVEAGLEDQLTEIAAALDLAIPGYVTSALGAAEAERIAAPTADLATLASSPADTVRSAATRPGPELPLTPDVESIADDQDEALLEPSIRTFELPDFGALA
jgi:flagellar biosynthesis/type III secretory pathway protein FliH